MSQRVVGPIDRRAFLGASAVAGLGVTAAAQAPSTAVDTSRLGRTPHSRFAVNVEMWWGRLPFLERVARAADFGFPAIEFWPWQNKARDPKIGLDNLRRLCDERQLEIAQFTAWGFEPGMNHPQNLDKFLAAVEEGCGVAKRLRCPKMTVVGGNDQPGMTQAQMHDQIIAALQRAAPIAAEHEVMLILEPMNIRVDHKGHCLYGSPDAVRICREVNSPWVKINWDLYHMQISEGDLCGRLREGFDQVGYLQLADHPGRNEPGTGEVHYQRVLREAYELGYRDPIGLELRPKTTELAAAEAVAAADAW